MKEQWCLVYSKSWLEKGKTQYEINVLFKDTLDEIKKEIENLESLSIVTLNNYGIILITKGINPNEIKELK